MSSIERYDHTPPKGLILIGPISIALIMFSVLAGYYIFLDPSSASYDVQIGMTLVVSVVVILLAVATKRVRVNVSREHNIKNTLLIALVAASAASVIAMLSYIDSETYSVLTTELVLFLALPAIFEECLRVGMFIMFQRLVGTRVAIVFQGLLFAMWHTIARTDIDATYFFVLVAGGIIIMIAIVVSQNILAGIIAHAIINLRPLLFVLLLSPVMLLIMMLTVLIIIVRRFSHS